MTKKVIRNFGGHSVKIFRETR